MVKRRLLGGIALCFSLTVAIAEPPTTAILGTPPQPVWSDLNSQQRDILAPLSSDWDKMENIRRKKWLGIAERYPGMKQDEQQRMKDRMREWAALPSEQRTKIRSSYKDFNQLPPEQKQLVRQKWGAYSNLPQEEQQRLREGGKSSKLLAQPAVESTNMTTTSPLESSAATATVPGQVTTKDNTGKR